jgi:hypothetical protein
VKVVAVPGQPPLEGLLRYVSAEHSFAFDIASPADLRERSGSTGVTSLSVGTLQIEVGIETGLLLFAWGLHPRTKWTLQSVGRPNPTMGTVRLETSAPLERGVSLQLAAVGDWATAFDEVTGWLRVAEHPGHLSEEEILIATSVVVGITGGRLDALWLEPILE